MGATGLVGVGFLAVFSSVMPDLIRHPVDARLRGEMSLLSPRTWAGWIPAQGRYDGCGDAAQVTSIRYVSSP